MPRCLWCHQSNGDLRTVVIQSGPARQSVSVHPEHEALVIDWHDFAVKHQASFVLRLAMLPLALLALIGLASLVSKHLILVPYELSSTRVF